MHPTRSAAALSLLLIYIGLAFAAEDDYHGLLGLSYSFYQGQMSGSLPAWNKLLHSKPGGYKRDSHMDDGNPIGKDMSGGFYDAGDYLKCPLPLGWTLSNLVLSCLEFKAAYEAAGHWDTAVNVIRWGADWMIKAHVNASDVPAENAFVGQLSDKSDHNYFGRPEHATNPRPVYLVNSSTGGADVAAEYAAAFAATAVLFEDQGDSKYAETLFKRAKQAFGFAEKHQKNWKVPDGVFQAYSTYAYHGYLAHLAWASAWMCKYSNSSCGTADKYWSIAQSAGLQYSIGYDWDSVLPGTAVLMLTLNRNTDTAKNQLENIMLTKWQDTSSLCPKPAYSTVCYTPKGLAYYSDWGTLRDTANAMFIATLAGKYGTNKQQHICWARQQMRYALGSLNTAGKSYVIGYGPSQPQRPHHRPSACAPKCSEPCKAFDSGTCCAGETGTGPRGCCDSANFFSSHPALTLIRGALVGGPDQQDNFPDIRSDYQRSEVAMDYNAGFSGALAGLAHYAKAGLLGACESGTSSGSNSSASPSPSPTPPPPPAATPAPASEETPIVFETPAVTYPQSKEGIEIYATILNSANSTAAAPAAPTAAGKASSMQVTVNVPAPSTISASIPAPVKADTAIPAAKLPLMALGKAAAAGGLTLGGFAVSASAGKGVTPSCGNILGVWKQCGGKSACPLKTGKCTDSPWQGFCCAAGHACVRQDEYYYQCKPSLTTTATFSATFLSTDAAATVQSYDALRIEAPESATAGKRQKVYVSLLRQGQPVAGASIQMTISTWSTRNNTATGKGAITANAVTTATIIEQTGRDGRVAVKLPWRVIGTAGHESVLSAVTADGRARGAKGYIVAQAQDVILRWR